MSLNQSSISKLDMHPYGCWHTSRNTKKYAFQILLNFAIKSENKLLLFKWMSLLKWKMKNKKCKSSVLGPWLYWYQSGITLNSCLGKLFSHALNERISNFLEDKSFIGKEQVGYRKYHRTSDQMFILKAIIDKYIHKNGQENKLHACFIDLRKAFDTVWHEVRWSKW